MHCLSAPGRCASEIAMECFSAGVLSRPAGKSRVVCPLHVRAKHQIERMLDALDGAIQKNA